MSDPQYPGDQVLGTFRFNATLDWSKTTCSTGTGGIVQLADAGLQFEATFSRDTTTDAGYLTVQGFARNAEYNEQRAKSVYSVNTTLAGCGNGCEGASIRETLDTVLLSNSQDDFFGRSCAALGDGGVPGADAGVQPPGPTPNGYDVQRACGSLMDEFIPGTKNCTCTSGCRAVYTVEGTRVK
ncbi:hypothetical protein [Hyalangium versicolor]|uniref:hypothetical protein n=1 Tax=Hyalangium versicolor TaxID=2861190 RepID=UPI001CCFC174|nr:hypothetical protein [Hyalangium versicolor]